MILVLTLWCVAACGLALVIGRGILVGQRGPRDHRRRT